MNKNKSNIFENLLCLYLICEPLTQSLKLLFGLKAQFIFPIIYLIFIFFNIKNIKKSRIFFAVFLFFFLSMIRSLIGYQDYLYNFFGLMYLLFVTSLPWLLVGLNIKDTKYLFEKIKKYSILILISNLVLLCICYFIKKSFVGNMEISYSILPITLFSLYFFFEQKNAKSLIFSVFGFFVIIAFGSRGPLLCLLVFIVIFLLLNIKKHKVLFSLLILVVGILIFQWEAILNTTINTLTSNNIESRTLYKLKNGDINNDTGRGKIHDVVYEVIDKYTFTGIGLGVERILINRNINSMTKDMSSCYPHNLFLELLAQYGVIFGGLLCASIIFVILFAVVYSKNLEKNLIIILFCLEFVRLMISSSYIVSPFFFFFIGICVNFIKEVQNEKKGITNSTKYFANSSY